MFALQGAVFPVGQFGVGAIGFVAAGGEDALDGGIAARRFQNNPGAFDVGLEGGHGRAVGDAHLRLRSQVEDGVNLVLGQGAFHQLIIAHVAAHDVYVVDVAGAGQLSCGPPGHA
jgi:hypothetical protein